jgi:hypothetical protein
MERNKKIKREKITRESERKEEKRKEEKNRIEIKNPLTLTIKGHIRVY